MNNSKGHVKKRKLKKWVKCLLILFLIFTLMFTTYKFLFSKTSFKRQEVLFKVENGSSVYKVGKKLKEKGLIHSYYAYKIYVKLNNINAYKAGTYRLDKTYNLKKIVSILLGKTYLEDGYKVTFKEGKNIREIAKTISNNTNLKEEDFYNLLNDESYIDSLINKYWFLTNDIKNKEIYYPLEGYLYPDTYYFNTNVTCDVIINTMLRKTDKVLTKYKSSILNSGMTINQVVTLSSIIEQEGLYKDDRKKIAGVFYNRLKSNMSLGSDITTYYAFKVDLGTRDLTTKEINTYNPYNTRGPLMNGKLPVGAVGNFSESSLDATLNPDVSDYYYFVADKNGKTHFTRTYSEHQKVIKELKESDNWISF